MMRWSEKVIHKEKGFIEDGIIDTTRWQKANRKVILLLKEAYDGYGNLCQLIRDEWKGPKYKIWWTASYWLYALQKITANYIPPFPKEQKEFDECREYLLSSAIINIKKSGGKAPSEYEDILKYAIEDSKLLKDQITLINPDIILCGSTFNYLKKFWTDEMKQIGDTEFIFKTGNCILINYWHPANHYPNKLCYYALCAVIKNSNIFEHK